MATELSSRPKPSGVLTLLWTLFFFFVFALIVTSWVRCSADVAVTQDPRAGVRSIKLRELTDADNARLSGYGVVDQAKGVAHIALADAKKLFLAETKAKAVTVSALKVEPPLPMPALPDPASTEPPPMALPSAPQGADAFVIQHVATLPITSAEPVSAGTSAPALEAGTALQPTGAVPPAPNSPTSTGRPPLINSNESAPLTK